MVYVILLYALFALCYPLCKIAFHYINPIFFTGICFFLAGIMHLSYRVITDKSKLIIKKEHLIPLALLIICNIYLTNTLGQWGLAYLTAAKTCFIYNLCPFFSAIISYFWLAETMTTKKWVGFFIGFIGFIPFFAEKSDLENVTGKFFLLSWPEIAVILAAISTVIGWISMRKLILLNFDCVSANGWSMFIGGILMIASSLSVTQNWSAFLVTDWSGAWPFILSITLISYVIAYNIYAGLLSRYTATFVTMVGLSSPLFTAIFGWLLLGEQVGWTFVVSMVMVSIGIFLFYQEELSQQTF